MILELDCGNSFIKWRVLQAAILDWAGTVVDFGSFAPTRIFVEAFAEFDVQVSIEEARGPMGFPFRRPSSSAASSRPSVS